MSVALSLHFATTSTLLFILRRTTNVVNRSAGNVQRHIALCSSAIRCFYFFMVTVLIFYPSFFLPPSSHQADSDASAAASSPAKRPSRAAGRAAAAKLDSSKLPAPETNSEEKAVAEASEEEDSDAAIEQNDDSDDSDDSDDEAEKARAAAAALKTPKTKAQRKTPKASTGRRSSKKASASFVAYADESDLFNALLSGAPAEEVGNWIARYEDDQHAASAELLTLIVRCCGSQDVVKRKMLDNVQKACTDISDKYSKDKANTAVSLCAARSRVNIHGELVRLHVVRL